MEIPELEERGRAAEKNILTNNYWEFYKVNDRQQI